MNVKLKSGSEMPMLGLGTWDLRGQDCRQALKIALDLGYTHIDTAWMYKNQGVIGDTLKEVGADRDRLFITSKVWHTHLHYDGVLEQCEESLRDLQIDYVDLFLIHWPNEEVPLTETFKAMKQLFDEGKVRSVGVSNFSVTHLEESQSVSEVPIAVNQIKCHPSEEKRDVLTWCNEHDVVVTAYTPLGRGAILTEPTLVEIAERHSKTPGQVALRWLVQQGMVVIPKASSEAHLRENMDVFDWSLSAEEMEQVSRMSDSSDEANS
jgi:2,5-diketo-D-gluconate reductase B